MMDEIPESGNVVRLHGETTLPLTPQTVLNGAAGVNEVVVIGWYDDGSMHLAMSDPDMSRAILLLEIAKRNIIDDLARRAEAAAEPTHDH